MIIVPSNGNLHPCHFCQELTPYEGPDMEQYLVTGSYTPHKGRTKYTGIKATVRVPMCLECSTKNDEAGVRGIAVGSIVGILTFVVFACLDFLLLGLLIGLFTGLIASNICNMRLRAKKVPRSQNILVDMYKFGFRSKYTCRKNIQYFTKAQVASKLSELVNDYDYEIYDDECNLIVGKENAISALGSADVNADLTDDLDFDLDLDLELDLDLDCDDDGDFDFDFD